MAEAVTLIGRSWSGGQRQETRRQVLADLQSVGYREFYAASGTDYHPELKIVLTDYLDYEAETLAETSGVLYRIIRAYRKGQSIELTCERAPAGEAVDG